MLLELALDNTRMGYVLFLFYFIYLLVFPHTENSEDRSTEVCWHFMSTFVGRKYALNSPAEQKLINVPVGLLPYRLCGI